MDRDDPIAQLLALDPANAKSVDEVVDTLADARELDRILASAPQRARWPRHPRLALLVVTTTAVVILAALIANPLSRSGTITAARAEAQTAAALNLKGAWHVIRVTQISQPSVPSSPQFSDTVTDDAWHAPNGRLAIRSTIGSASRLVGTTTLYAHGELLRYVPDRKITYVHRFLLAADMRDDERSYLPPSAADLYRAAYRQGNVRLAGIETLHGRRVYRLTFDWLGSSYTLIFDADRRVPISSEARTPEPNVRGGLLVTRVRYTVYERVALGRSLESHLRLPSAARGSKRVPFAPIVIPRPVQGASAKPLVQAVVSHLGTAFPSTAAINQATYALVLPLPGRGLAAVARIPNRSSQSQPCVASVTIAHPGGEATLHSAGCNIGAANLFWSQDDGTAIVVGDAAQARRVDIRLADGTTIRAHTRRGVYAAAFAARLIQSAFSIAITHHDGSVTTRRSSTLPSPLPLAGPS